MTSNDPKQVVDAAEAAIYSLEVAKDNIERYLRLHGLVPHTDGRQMGRAAEFHMGGAEVKAEFDASINHSLELTIKSLEQFLAQQPK